MKKACIFFLVSIFLCTNTTIGELLKSPVLIVHFLDHQQRNPGISFTDFLSMHYLGNDIHDNDQNQDMKLPFKKMIHTSHLVLFRAEVQLFCAQQHHVFVDHSYFYRDEFILHRYSSEIYRPPQYS